MSDASDPPAFSPIAPTDPDIARVPDVDLDAIERDLAAVDVALGRLADGTYWTDEVTGAPLPHSLLDVDPTARRG